MTGTEIRAAYDRAITRGRALYFRNEYPEVGGRVIRTLYVDPDERPLVECITLVTPEGEEDV